MRQLAKTSQTVTLVSLRILGRGVIIDSDIEISGPARRSTTAPCALITLSRSRSGVRSSCASWSTRRLNSSQERSRSSQACSRKAVLERHSGRVELLGLMLLEETHLVSA